VAPFEGLEWNARHGLPWQALGSKLSVVQAGEMEPDGQTFTHIGESFSPSHSVQTDASMV
jgi:hypothetical protein